MTLRRLILSICLLTITSLASFAANTWEAVDRLPGTPVEQRVDTEDDVYTTVADGYVYVVVRQRVPVKIFTILGQLVIQDNLQPGIYRYKLPTRGIYLLKAGSATRRVTV